MHSQMAGGSRRRQVAGNPPSVIHSVRPHPILHTRYSILYTRTSGFNALTAAFSSLVITLMSPDASIGAPTMIVTPRR